MTTPVSAQVTADERFAVHDLLMTYVYAIDTGDAQGYAGTFKPDGVLITSEGERFAGRAAILDYARRVVPKPGGRGRQHHFQQIRVSREGEGIRVFSFWMVAQRTSEPDATRVRSIGSCDDLCVKTADGWRFAERKIGRWTDATAPWSGG